MLSVISVESPIQDRAGFWEARRWLAARPFLFGTIVGGLPLGMGFAFLGRQVISPEILWFVVALAPWGILVTCVGAVLGENFSWLGLLGRTMLISLGSWVVVPFGICWGLAWRAGEDVFSGKNVGVLAGIFWIWAVVLAVPCSMAAVGYAKAKVVPKS